MTISGAPPISSSAPSATMDAHAVNGESCILSRNHNPRGPPEMT